MDAGRPREQRTVQQVLSVDAFIMPLVLCSALTGLGLPRQTIFIIAGIVVLGYAVANAVARYYVFAMPHDHHEDGETTKIEAAEIYIQEGHRSKPVAAAVGAVYLVCGAIVLAPFLFAGAAPQALEVTAGVSTPLLAVVGGWIAVQRRASIIAGVLSAVGIGAGAASLVYLVVRWLSA